VVHLAHSSLTFLLAIKHVLGSPGSWVVNGQGWQHGGGGGLLPDLLVCTSAGFFGFHLFVLVHQR